MSVYFPGTATVTRQRRAAVGFNADTLVITPDVEASIGRRYESTFVVAPVRDDPVVAIRLLTGESLAEYLSRYLFSLVEADQGDYAGESSDERRLFTSLIGEVSELLWRKIDNISTERRDFLQIEGAFEEITLGEGEEFALTVSGTLPPLSHVNYAVEALTKDGLVVSDIEELRSDEEGRIFGF